VPAGLGGGIDEGLRCCLGEKARPPWRRVPLSKLATATVITGSAAPIATAALPEISINGGASPPARNGILTDSTLWQ
jgi:hypothetical protein